MKDYEQPTLLLAFMSVTVYLLIFRSKELDIIKLWKKKFMSYIAIQNSHQMITKLSVQNAMLLYMFGVMVNLERLKLFSVRNVDTERMLII